MKTLNDQVAEIESYIPHLAKKNETVSKVSIGWQLDHTLRVINSIVKTLETSDPKAYQSKFSFLGFIFITFKFLPRGKAKAPKRVLPEDVISAQDLKRRVGFAKENLEKLNEIDSNCHFPHPYFGSLKLEKAKKFIAIHTEHHLKIVREILN
jgi:hypothetical protein